MTGSNVLDKVHIKVLPHHKIRTLMKGGAIRVHMPSSAMEAMEMFVMPHHTKKMMSKFGKGKAHTLRLSPEEIQENMMEGGTLSSMLKKGLKYAAPVLKQGARAGIAMGSAALAASNPALIPFIPAGASMLGAMSDNAFDEMGKMNVDDAVEEGYGSPEVGQYTNIARQHAQKYATQHIQKHPSYQRGLAEVQKYAPILHKTNAHAYLKHAQEEPYAQLGNAGMREMASYGKLGANYHQLANQVKAAHHRQSFNPSQSHHLAQIYQAKRPAFDEYADEEDDGMYGGGMFAGGALKGQGLYAGAMRGGRIEKSTVRIGGNLISAFGGSHPATISNPLSVNFASRNFLPPNLQATIL